VSSDVVRGDLENVNNMFGSWHRGQGGQAVDVSEQNPAFNYELASRIIN
jgi:hypothetical protein